MPSDERRTRLFLSYSRRDKEVLKRVKMHLVPVMEGVGVDVWDDSRIKPGDPWQRELADSLATTNVAVVLVSAAYLASPFVKTKELPVLLSRAAGKGVRVLPLIVSPCAISLFPELNEIQSVNNQSSPFLGMDFVEQEACLVDLALAARAACLAPEVGHSSRAPRERSTEEELVPELVVLKTRNQRMVLRVTSAGLECHLEDRRAGRGGHQWTLSPDEASIAARKRNVSVVPDYTQYSGLFNVGSKRNWIYTKKLFPKPSALKEAIVKLLLKV